MRSMTRLRHKVVSRGIVLWQGGGARGGLNGCHKIRSGSLLCVDPRSPGQDARCGWDAVRISNCRGQSSPFQRRDARKNPDRGLAGYPGGFRVALHLQWGVQGRGVWGAMFPWRVAMKPGGLRRSRVRAGFVLWQKQFLLVGGGRAAGRRGGGKCGRTDPREAGRHATGRCVRRSRDVHWLGIFVSAHADPGRWSGRR